VAKLAGEADEGRVKGPLKDAISALVNLGYGQPQAAAAVAAASKTLGEEAAVSALIRQGLKELAK
jgi:holliday junction DNA helicase RuvA